ncbi:MAG: aminomethyl transferase family protein [Nitrospirae bacterium]|nr:aminomethyl transferase family protein [Nitrospirota bacterium]
MKKLPLHDKHAALGARFTEFNGWEIPSRYDDPVGEHQAVRQTAGLFDLSHRGKIRIDGRDRVKFLQGLVTQDIPKLKEGEGTYAVITTLKGHMVSDVRVLALSEAFLLEVEPGYEKPVLDHLNRYAVVSNVVIKEVTEDWGLLSIQGPASRTVLEGWLGSSLNLEKEFDHTAWDIPGVTGTAGEAGRFRIVRAPRFGSQHGPQTELQTEPQPEMNGYDLWIPADRTIAVWDSLRASGAAASLRPAGMATLETLRIEAGIPRFGADMNEETIPLEAGLAHRAISFEKGCYLGQEPIARIHFRGHVNWHLTGLTLEGEGLPHSGDKLYKDDKEVGWLTSIAFSPALQKPIALGYVHRGHQEPGESLQVESSGKRTTALVAAIPFTPAGSK